jgi:quinol monooxygenase YgiN
MQKPTGVRAGVRGNRFLQTLLIATALWKRSKSVTQGTRSDIHTPLQYVLIIHEVENYPAWKKIFDGASGIRKEAGERSYQVLKYHDHSNKIVHFSAWTSIDDARKFFESPRLVKIREEAGVKAPEFIYLDQIDAGNL